VIDVGDGVEVLAIWFVAIGRRGDWMAAVTRKPGRRSPLEVSVQVPLVPRPPQRVRLRRREELVQRLVERSPPTTAINRR
jgi:hypothetical protein